MSDPVEPVESVPSAEPAEPVETAEPGEEKLSKRQQKKIAKRAHLKELWEKERDKRKEKVAKLKAQRKENPEEWVPKQRKKGMWREIEAAGQKAAGTVVMDCSFCDQLTEKENKSLASQIGYSYGVNGRSYTSSMFS